MSLSKNIPGMFSHYLYLIFQWTIFFSLRQWDVEVKGGEVEKIYEELVQVAKIVLLNSFNYRSLR